MKWIAHRAAAAVAVIAAVIVFCIPCCALFEPDELRGALPEDAARVLDDRGVTPEGGAESISVPDILEDIMNAFRDNVGAPLRMFAALLAVILLSALLESIGSASGGKLAGIYTLVTSAVAAVTVAGSLSVVTETAKTAFRAASDFMLVYIPVVAGVTAAGGHTTSAAVYSSVTIGAIQLLSWAVSAVVIPLTSCILGISAASCVGGDMGLDRLGEGIKKAVIWGLGLIMTLFLGILSVQTVITASADNAAMKALKFTVSSSVPIVGGAASDALAAVKGSISVLKSGVGGFGIAAAVCVLAPPVIATLCYRFFLFAAGVVSDLFGCAETGKMIRSGSGVMAVINAALCCFMLFIVISSAMLMAFCRT